MAFRKTDHDGYVMVDHRASPGIPEPQARRMGLDPNLFGEGKLFEGASLGCPHCGGSVILNPMRTRERNNCRKCNVYICDLCAIEAAKPDYVHRTFREVVDMVQSGRYRLIGGTASAPILIKV